MRSNALRVVRRVLIDLLKVLVYGAFELPVQVLNRYQFNVCVHVLRRYQSKICLASQNWQCLDVSSINFLFFRSIELFRY